MGLKDKKRVKIGQKPKRTGTHGRSVTGFVCGIIALMVPASGIFGVVAVTLGISANRYYRKHPEVELNHTDNTLALIGKILGYISFVEIFLLLISYNYAKLGA